MPLPSPDAALVSATDALLAVPQRRGVPLPRVVASAYLVAPLPFLAVAATLPGVGQLWIAPAWIVAGVVIAFLVRRIVRTLRSDAEAWSPKAAMDWRARAVSFREGQAGIRGFMLFLLSFEAVAIAWLSTVPPLWPLALNLAAYAGVTLVGTLLLYARCAIPHDPDLTQRSRDPGLSPT